jgi:hypothetical protein
VENAYERIVTFDGNQPAQKLLAEVFEVTDRAWRGIGVIPKSGWRLSEAYREFDAEERFQITGIHTEESPLCRAGDVLRGAIKPAECAAFGKECTPRHPLGATMVSSEGACAAYLQLRAISCRRKSWHGAGAGLGRMPEIANVIDRPPSKGAPGFLQLVCPLPLAGLSHHRDGPRRRRQAGQRAGRAPVSARLPQSGARKSGRCGGARSAAAGWP